MTYPCSTNQAASTTFVRYIQPGSTITVSQNNCIPLLTGSVNNVHHLDTR